jgi:transposase InsO family protein
LVDGEALRKRSNLKIKIKDVELLTDERKRFIIPDQCKNRLITILHNKLIHPGRNQLIKTIQNNFALSGYTLKVKLVVEKCTICSENKLRRSNYGTLSGGIHSSKPFEMISTDIFGPVKLKHFKNERRNEYFYIVTIMDTFSRWVETKIIFDIKSNTIVNAIDEKWLSKFGSPTKLLSDQGRQYISKNFADMCEKFKIKHYLTTSHNPTGNSLSERINQIIGEVCRMSRGMKLSELEERINTRLNYNTNRVTGYSPYEIMFRKNAFNEKELNFNDEELRKIAEKHKKATKNTQNKRISSRIKKFNFKINEWVYKKTFSPDKVDPVWKGPFKILNVDKNGNYVEIQENFKTTKQNIKNLRPYFRRGEDAAVRSLTKGLFELTNQKRPKNNGVYKLKPTGTHAILQQHATNNKQQRQRIN